MTSMFEQLAAPFPPDRISWRVGSVKKDGTAAMALAYIDARDVMERLDAVCGPDGWERRHPHVDKTTTCEIAIWVEGRGWVVKADGAGDTAVEAEKGSLSDSFKRAAVNWGVGRYLYDIQSPWVRIDAYKKIVPEELPKLRALLQRQAPAYNPDNPPPSVKAVTPPGVMTGTQLQAALEASVATGRKSSAQAKKDGDDVTIKADINSLDAAGIFDWRTNFDNYTSHLPISWLDSIHNMLELREEELKGAAAVADDDTGMDEAFRGAVGPRGHAPLAGRTAPHRGAAA